MRFRGLDLNLVHLLDILLEERSVSRTAERLHLSQPAVSSSLSRLREYFGDELLVQSGRRMIPTAFSEALLPLIKQMLESVENLLSTSSKFDPASSQRRFKIGASDYITAVLIAPLVRRLEVIAPNVSINLIPTGGAINQMLDRGEIDLVLSPEQWMQEQHPSRVLFRERHVIVAAADNAEVASGVDMAKFLELPHLAVNVGLDQELSFAERHLLPYREQRKIVIRASTFTMVPWLLLGTKRIAVLQERLARSLMASLPLQVAELPFSMPLLVEMAQWNSTRSNDPGIRWFLGELEKTAATPGSD